MSDTRERKTRNPVQTRSQKTRGKILTAGRELFSLKGYHGTNSKEIARTAGVATGSFYAYFPNKGAVFLEITKAFYQQIFGKVRDTMEGIDPTTNRRKIIAGLVRTLYDAHEIEPELHREISMIILAGTNHTAPESNDQRLYGEVHRCVEEMDRMVHIWLTDLLIRWGAESVGRNPVVVAELVFRVTEETIHRLRQFPETMSEPKPVLQELIKMLDDYLNGILLK